METRHLKAAACEPVQNAPIKQEVEWLAEDSHAPDLASQQLKLELEPIRLMYTEEDPQFTPVPQTDEFIKAELILDEEIRDKINDSEENCNQLVLPLADDQQSTINKSDKEMRASSSAQKGNLNIHMHIKRFDKSESITPFECEFCTRSFKTKGVLERHLSTHATNRKRNFLCNICERSFYENSKLVRHMKLYAQKDHPKFNCEVCSLRFTRKGDLDVHMLTKHLDQSQSVIPAHPTAEVGKTKFPCGMCERTFSTKISLRNHHEDHAKKVRIKYKASKFTCEVCGSSYTEKTNLRYHMLRKHLGKGQSNTSGLQTADVDSIDPHMEEFLAEEATSHGQTSQESGRHNSESQSDTKREACDVCHCIYPTEYIRVHMRLEHSEPKHKCEFCSRVFGQKCHLIKHLKTHATNRKRDFVCDICERAFYDNKGLGRHMKVYAQKDHPKSSCEVCLSSFTRKGDLDAHMLTKHLDKSQPIILPPQAAEDGNQEFPYELCERKFSNEISLGSHHEDQVKKGRTDYTEKNHIVRKHLGKAQSNTSGPQTSVDDKTNTHQEESLDEEAASNGQPSQESVAKDSASKSDVKGEACEVCHCIYPTEYIRLHIRLAHSAPERSSNQPKYKCAFCSRVFMRKGCLERHLSIHSTNRKRDFPCDICGRAFYDQSHLNAHKKRYAEKDHPKLNCDVCR